MPRHVSFSQQSISISDVAAYHQDVESALRVNVTIANPNYSKRFIGYFPDEIITELHNRLEETDLRSSLAILTRLEAAFRIDYLQRCQLRKRDDLSRAFRDLYKNRKRNVRLDDDIFATWQQIAPATKKLIGDLRGAFKFRHWLAHGRYWVLKAGGKYDYQSIYVLADAVLASFPFYGRNGRVTTL